MDIDLEICYEKLQYKMFFLMLHTKNAAVYCCGTFGYVTIIIIIIVN